MSNEPIRVPRNYKLNGWKDWRISQCTVYNPLNEILCTKSCRIRDHCVTYIAIMNRKEKVQFT